jgi:putative polyhydroxyalkanoate system protein
MADIKIERNHSLGKAEAKKRVLDLETKLKEKYGVKLDWRGDKADVKGTGVSGSLDVGEARVALELKLGLLLKPMGGKIRQAIERTVDKALNGA